MRPGILAIAALIALAIWFAPAMAWNFAVHEMVTRIAIGALPPGPLKSAFLAHMSELEHFSIVLRERSFRCSESERSRDGGAIRRAHAQEIGDPAVDDRKQSRHPGRSLARRRLPFSLQGRRVSQPLRRRCQPTFA
jgi:hypothetical protein